MGLVLFSLALSSIFLLLVVWIARRAGSGGVCALSVAYLLVGASFPAVGFQCLLTFVVALGCLVTRAKPAVVIGLSLSAMVGAYGFIWFDATERLQVIAELRQKYPIESIEDRLAYEANWNAENGLAPNAKFPDSINDRMKYIDHNDDGYRRYMLSRLHDETYEQFVIARGFGNVRMIGLNPTRIELPEIAAVPQPEASDDTCSRDDEQVIATDARPVERVLHLAEDHLLDVHDVGLLDFLAPDRWGYVESRERVVGFEPHQFSALPDVEHHDWQITRLDLISLLKHEEPVAYVSENLPSMEELADAPVRPLNEFERAAVGLLRTDSDLEISYDMNRIDMVGSVRAAESCTECHTVPRGHLLGAFSYVLRRTTPVRLVDSIEGD